MWSDTLLFPLPGHLLCWSEGFISRINIGLPLPSYFVIPLFPILTTMNLAPLFFILLYNSVGSCPTNHEPHSSSSFFSPCNSVGSYLLASYLASSVTFSVHHHYFWISYLTRQRLVTSHETWSSSSSFFWVRLRFYWVPILALIHHLICCRNR